MNPLRPCPLILLIPLRLLIEQTAMVVAAVKWTYHWCCENEVDERVGFENENERKTGNETGWWTGKLTRKVWATFLRPPCFGPLLAGALGGLGRMLWALTALKPLESLKLQWALALALALAQSSPRPA